MTTTSILGETRQPARIWPDGSYTCPFCGGAILAEWEPTVTSGGYVARCRNPVCEAGPTTVEHAQERRQAHEEHLARMEEGRRRHENSMRYLAASRQARDQQVAEWHQEAKREGFCWTCLYRSDGRRKIKHRTSDYHEK